MKGGLIVNDLNFGILNNISFSFEKGTFNALIGKTGSGKSLLLKCIAGLYEYSGTIEAYGNIIKKSYKENMNIGIFTPSFTFMQRTTFENLMEPLINLGYDETIAKKKVYDISKKIGIESLIYKSVDTLSHTEKNMIAISKVLISDPSIILLDNLFESLDNNYKNKLISYLKSLKKSIIIFTTNDSEDLMLADNIVILKSGKIVESGPKEVLFEKESAFTKSGVKLPFIIDLSHKLKSYELIDSLIYTSEDMVNKLWK